MQDNSKFLGICILIASFLLSGAIIVHGNTGSATDAADTSRSDTDAADTSTESPQPIGRYQFHPSDPPGVIWILDTTTGEVKTQSG
jgi:hypothetical protein